MKKVSIGILFVVLSAFSYEGFAQSRFNSTRKRSRPETKVEQSVQHPSADTLYDVAAGKLTITGFEKALHSGK
ncbi:MAG: hypothetical protein K2O12_01280, partial [Muribaculaceae bacterium]|nr:hypothetical protein [Muribaculaceae bacterium]